MPEREQSNPVNMFESQEIFNYDSKSIDNKWTEEDTIFGP